MLNIVGFNTCPFTQRVIATLEAKNVTYEIEYINKWQPPEWSIEILPKSYAPLLIAESGTFLFESDAIIEFLDEVYEPLQVINTPEQYTFNRYWSHQASKLYLVQCSAMRSPDEKSFIEKIQKLEKAIAKLEKVLGSGPFFCGASIGNVDISWLPLLHRVAIIEWYTGYDLLRNYPKVSAWQMYLLRTELVEKSISIDFDKSFTKYYLSANTYLGKAKNGY